ncbi:hypothetical protein Taro_003018 [Colocasia esculenta]|uniref:Uncharacterized protein n=1 Tax=Colocasia esculenta TaxID=4460 RepID=A0A843TN03_COLES|nr:hypothetical protein [Colocasia esculenta]
MRQRHTALACARYRLHLAPESIDAQRLHPPPSCTEPPQSPATPPLPLSSSHTLSRLLQKKKKEEEEGGDVTGASTAGPALRRRRRCRNSRHPPVPSPATAPTAVVPFLSFPPSGLSHSGSCVRQKEQGRRGHRLIRNLVNLFDPVLARFATVTRLLQYTGGAPELLSHRQHKSFVRAPIHVSFEPFLVLLPNEKLTKIVLDEEHQNNYIPQAIVDILLQTGEIIVDGDQTIVSDGAVGPEEENVMALALPAPPPVSEDLRAVMDQVEEAFQGEKTISVDNGSLSKVGRLHCQMPWWEDATVDFMASGGYNVISHIKEILSFLLHPQYGFRDGKTIQSDASVAAASSTSPSSATSATSLPLPPPSYSSFFSSSSDEQQQKQPAAPSRPPASLPPDCSPTCLRQLMAAQLDPLLAMDIIVEGQHHTAALNVLGVYIANYMHYTFSFYLQQVLRGFEEASCRRLCYAASTKLLLSLRQMPPSPLLRPRLRRLLPPLTSLPLPPPSYSSFFSSSSDEQHHKQLAVPPHPPSLPPDCSPARLRKLMAAQLDPSSPWTSSTSPPPSAPPCTPPPPPSSSSLLSHQRIL